jgi:hypothetical protein
MIIVAMGVVVLLALVCAGAAAGFLFYARARRVEMVQQEAEMMRLDAMQAMQQDAMAKGASGSQFGESSPPATDFAPEDLARTEWSYPTSPEGAAGVLKRDAAGWTESRATGVFAHFTDVVRTDEYVELYDSSRRLYVRLYDDHMEWRREGQAWSRGQAGAWKSAENEMPAEPAPAAPSSIEPVPF